MAIDRCICIYLIHLIHFYFGFFLSNSLAISTSPCSIYNIYVQTIKHLSFLIMYLILKIILSYVGVLSIINLNYVCRRLSGKIFSLTLPLQAPRSVPADDNNTTGRQDTILSYILLYLKRKRFFFSACRGFRKLQR